MLLLLGILPVNSSAQILVDPTKPPGELNAHFVETVTNDLQSVIISPNRRAAIINGQTVELGGKTGDVRLIEVNEAGVVLQGSNGRQELSLFPNVKMVKKVAAPASEYELKLRPRKEKQVAEPVNQTGMKEEK